MRDLITTLMGKRYCGWCSYKKSTRWEKFMRFDQIVPFDQRRWYENIAWHLYDFNDRKFRIWALGYRFHRKFHVKEDSDVAV